MPGVGAGGWGWGNTLSDAYRRKGGVKNSGMGDREWGNIWNVNK